MKLGWYRTTETSAFQRYHPLNLIQPSSPCCLLPSQVMELCSEPEWLLLQILCWKARPIGPFGQAIELWVCAQRFVCVCGLDGLFSGAGAVGRLDGEEGQGCA